MRFNPNQLRAPQGTPDGGQWVDAYHGTSPANVEGIRSVGIVAGARGGPYVTTDKEVARRFGEAVVNLRIPRSVLQTFKQESVFGNRFLRGKGEVIPRNWLTGVTTYPLGRERTMNFGPRGH